MSNTFLSPPGRYYPVSMMDPIHVLKMLAIDKSTGLKIDQKTNHPV